MKAVIALLAVIPMAIPECGTTPSRPVRCIVGNDQVAVTGVQGARDAALAESTTLLATGAQWSGTSDYPVSFFGDAPGACLVGGTIVGTWPDSDRWSKWHFRGALRFSQPDFTVFGVHVVNTGDGIKPKDSGGSRADNFAIESSWVQHVHDDCIENDYAHTGLIRDNLFDGCYVLFSSRPSSSRIDGRRNFVRIDHNISALEPMQSVYKGSKPGTGGFFKWSDRAPAVVLTDNMFMARQLPNHGSLGPPPGPLLCSGNVIVWQGSGEFPELAAWKQRCPDTEVTTDASRYSEARDAWLDGHPGVR